MKLWNVKIWYKPKFCNFRMPIYAKSYQIFVVKKLSKEKSIENYSVSGWPPFKKEPLIWLILIMALNESVECVVTLHLLWFFSTHLRYQSLPLLLSTQCWNLGQEFGSIVRKKSMMKSECFDPESAWKLTKVAKNYILLT